MNCLCTCICPFGRYPEKKEGLKEPLRPDTTTVGKVSIRSLNILFGLPPTSDSPSDKEPFAQNPTDRKLSKKSLELLLDLVPLDDGIREEKENLKRANTL